MQHPGTDCVRGHLRLADAPVRLGFWLRMAAWLRALWAVWALLWATLAAWGLAALALAPLLVHRAPAGRRLRQRPPREARVIPFQPRRRAVPR